MKKSNKIKTKEDVIDQKLMKENNDREEKDKLDPSKIEGLQQFFNDDKGVPVKLASILTEKDFWQTGGKRVMTILTHDCVKRLADVAGLSKKVGYKILTQPDAYNNYQYTIEVTVCRLSNPDDCAVEIGEANRNNLGSKGRQNPANMAQKRAYDRAVLRLLGITGLLSEEELSDEENNNQKEMDSISPDDVKLIAPLVNQLLLAKTKEQLIQFNNSMKTKAANCKPEQLDYLRKLYKKAVAEVTSTKF